MLRFSSLAHYGVNFSILHLNADGFTSGVLGCAANDVSHFIAHNGVPLLEFMEWVGMNQPFVELGEVLLAMMQPCIGSVGCP